ncbi:hypothetical protein [Rheinheimera sp. 4Y26]|uniref:hypothetical protein n=1 Tax=Rheinheimera sp. 4Y26 TaxID=2977811 RepID=UPI0021B0D50F|nr:hypothetical protein [Rheinheimera sp. 4Y26]MCT6698158.1 hypothetical protein [Rheinheimera sp. 4Y26]
MPQVNVAFIEKLKNGFKHTRFSQKDFNLYFPDTGKVLVQIEFKYHKNYTFQISEEVEIDTVTQRDSLASVISGVSERKSKSIVHYAIFSPGECKRVDKIHLYELSNAPDYIEKWCRYLFSEISIIKLEDSLFDDLREQIEDQLKNNAVNENEQFSDEELSKINVKFDELLKNFEKLEEESKITKSNLEQVKKEFSEFKESAKVMPKGLWARVTNNRLVDIVVEFAKSKEGREFIISEIKKLMTGS